MAHLILIFFCAILCLLVPPIQSIFPSSCFNDYDCGPLANCYRGFCRCNLGAVDKSTETGCEEYQCTTNLECSTKFANTECSASICICKPEDYHFDIFSQQCEHDKLNTHDTESVSSMMGSIMLWIGVVLGVAFLLGLVGVVCRFYMARKLLREAGPDVYLAPVIAVSTERNQGQGQSQNQNQNQNQIQDQAQAQPQPEPANSTSGSTSYNNTVR